MRYRVELWLTARDVGSGRCCTGAGLRTADGEEAADVLHRVLKRYMSRQVLGVEPDPGQGVPSGAEGLAAYIGVSGMFYMIWLVETIGRTA